MTPLTSVLALACDLTGTVATAPAQAALLTAGTRLEAVLAALVDPSGTLSLSAGQFLVPALTLGADDLADWQFDLRQPDFADGAGVQGFNVPGGGGVGFED